MYYSEKKIFKICCQTHGTLKSEANIGELKKNINKCNSIKMNDAAEFEGLDICMMTCRYFGLVGFMVFNATFNNTSVISWQSILLVEETRMPREIRKSLTNFIT